MSSFADRSIVTAATVMAIVGLAAFWGLWSLSTPNGAGQVQSSVATQIAGVERAGLALRRTGLEPQAAFCPNLDPSTLSRVRAELGAGASRFGATTAAVRLTGPDNLSREVLAPVALSIEAEGSETDLINYAGWLAERVPTVFADTIDMNSDGKLVYLKIGGRLFCANDHVA